jgi:molecular chaperone GrpE
MMADTSTPETQENAIDTPEAPPSAGETALRAEVADLKDKMLRTLAEMENLRRRTEREIADARQYAVANFARDMLTVSDNLRRAIDALPKEQRESGDAAIKALVEGVEVTERGLEQALTKFGVKRIESKGQRFDPTFHQAMFEMETADVPPGTVTDEVQAGYVIGERVLRPSFVAVAKAPKIVAPEAKADAEKPA